MTGERQAQQYVSLDEALVLADRCRVAGRLSEAVSLCRQILAADPNSAAAEHLLGLIAHQDGKLGEAMAHVRRAIELAPRVAQFHANLGEMYRLSGDPRQAAEQARLALKIEPGMPAALSNLGIALYELRDYEGAARSHRKAIARQPDFVEAHNNLGNALHALRRFDEAVPCYHRAIELNPHFADAWSNLGTSLHHVGRYDEAIAALRRAIALDPSHANAHSGLGILLLMRGDMAEGWEEYEWRLKSTEVLQPYHPLQPWQGESLRGRRIYIHAEQGFGDIIQFARYVPLVAARGAAVTFRVQRELAALMRQSLPEVEVLGDRGEPAVMADCECALLSLPGLFGTRLETIPAVVPYLRADPGEVAVWRQRWASLGGLKVGLVWAGNPQHVNDSRRSIALGALRPLFAVPGVSFVSLQVGPRAAERDKHRDIRMTDIAPDLVGFAATAAAIEALDLVITIDSSVAHLAGALAKPTWLLMPWVSDWRWLMHREDSPWYPTLRMFRQVEGQSWSEVAARVAIELESAANGNAKVLTPFREAGERRARQAAETIAALESRRLAPTRMSAAPAAPQLLMLAEARRRAGQLAEADTLARRLLEAEPGHAEAHHLRGIIAHQSGHLLHAIEHIRRASQLAPDVALYHANLGEMSRLAGRIEEAIAAGERALALQPDFADALSNLGIARYEQGDFEAAVICQQRAVALKPDFAQAHSNLGNALRACKRLDEALPHYRRAIELNPAFGDAWNNLGTTLRDLKRHAEAEQAYRQALAIKRDDPDTLNNLGLVLKDLDRLDEAEAILRRSLAVDPSNAKTLLYLGTLLLDRHQAGEAIGWLERAIAINPQSHDAHNALGRAAFERNDLEGALRHHRRALQLHPDLADAHNNIGNVLKALGQLEEARQAYLKALALDPGITGVYVNYADAVRIMPDDPHFHSMQQMRADSAQRSDTEKLQLDYALAKAYADIRDHQRSFQHLLSGSALKRAQIQYDEAAELALFERIEKIFTPDLLRAKERLGGGDPSVAPIFILGMPRSGTTLVEQILASHHEVHGGGELATLSEVVAHMGLADTRMIRYPDGVAALDAAGITAIGQRYLAGLRKLAASAPRITDKMPSNFYYVGLIHLALPNARIIHTVRDPVDTCVSCFSKLFTVEQYQTYDLAELGRYYRAYHRLMAHWRGVLPSGRMLEVRYETVVADIEGEVRRMLDYCGLPWDQRCLSFHDTERAVHTASATQVRQPIYSGAIGRWRAYEEFLAPLLAALDLPGLRAAEGR